MSNVSETYTADFSFLERLADILTWAVVTGRLTDEESELIATDVEEELARRRQPPAVVPAATAVGAATITWTPARPRPSRPTGGAPLSWAGRKWLREP